MRIFVDQRAISRNSSREEQEPVFIIQDDTGAQRLAHGIAINGLAWLRYDKTQQPRAWIETSDFTEIESC